ncbi:cysteine dioxygenase family protein [Zobellella aerophila]|uniref:Cysteine dioxygenase n=1 Tax=Zobellella aerophila TaxID=870480 RepID=A0ABP6V2S0_9GAMM
MNTAPYSIPRFVEDVLRIMSRTQDEAALLAEVAPLAQRAAAEQGWRTPEMYLANLELGFGSTLLHAQPDHSLFIVVDSWLPGRGVRPHDHGTWAVVVAVTGPERNTFWERVDDGTEQGHARLRWLREQTVSAGEVVTMPTGAIHSVVNDGIETTLSFHVYGRHLNHTGRSQFDVEHHREIPFIIETR